MNWRETESMEDAARRLIGVLDERAKKRKHLAGGCMGPAEIADRPLSPDENADGASARGSGALKRRPQSTPVREDTGDHAAERGGNSSGLEFDGRAEFSTLGFVQSFSFQGTARPTPDDFLEEGRSRERHAPED